MTTSGKPSHVRSTSFPSESHPSLASVQQCLRSVELGKPPHQGRQRRQVELATSKTCTPPSMPSSNSLTQQALHVKERLAIELMDDFLSLMDACGMLKESLQHIREKHQYLSSILRRFDSGLETAIGAYRCSRKRMKKDMIKCQRLLRSMEKHVPSSDDNIDMVEQVFIDARAVTFSTISLLSSIVAGTKTTRSVFSRLLSTKIRGAESDEDGSEMERADAAIFRLCGHSSKTVKEDDARDARRQMEALEIGLKEMELRLEDVIRCMIQTRVSLLNIVTGY